MAVNLDTFAIAYADELLACLCSLLDDTVGGPVCRCSLRHGVPPPTADFCCDCGTGEGEAWVMVSAIYPSTRFPDEELSVGNCVRNEWAVELTLGVYRCVRVGDGQSPPTAEELRADTEKIMDDAAAMRCAITCCLPDNPLLDGSDILPGRWSPIESSGGCGGGTMIVTLRASGHCPTPTP